MRQPKLCALGLVSSLLLVGCGSGAEEADEENARANAVSTDEAEAADLDYEMVPATCLLEPSAEGLTTEESEEVAETDSDLAAPWLAGQPDEDLATALDNAVQGADADLDMDVGMVVLNRETGDEVTVNAGAETSAASLSKVVVAMSLLRLLDEQDEEITVDNEYLLEDALANSGNDATALIFDQLGAEHEDSTAYFAETYELLGITNTVPELGWGAEITSAEDQSRVIEALTTTPDWLTDEDVELIRGFMDPTQGYPSYTQGFGVGLLADESSWPEGVSVDEVVVKNGWLADDDGTWSVNTIGQATINGEVVDMVVTTHGAPNSECGFELLDHLVLIMAEKS